MFENKKEHPTRAFFCIGTAKFAVTISVLIFLTACGREETYDGFAVSYHQLLFDSEDYDSYVAANRPQDSEFFYPCLEKHMARHDEGARTRINACYDRCGRSDSVCNFNCNTSKGTEFYEARRDLLELKMHTLQQNLNLRNLERQGELVGEIECLAINTVRALDGKPALSCREIGAKYESTYMSENQCRFEQSTVDRLLFRDWEITG